MAAGQKTGGRTKGTPNKATKSVKEAIAFAAEQLGGGERLVSWAQEDPENETKFWVNIYPKLLPLDVNANVKLAIGDRLARALGRAE